MNEFIEYVCRGVIHSEDAIKHLNRKVVGLTKCHHNLAIGIICVSVVSLRLISVVYEQGKEIKVLKKLVADLVDEDEPKNTTDTMEEQNDQEGA